MRRTHAFPIILAALGCLTVFSCRQAAPAGDTTGVTDTEITIGSWGPMTGPAALWGNILKGADAYFKMINEEGGINGRQIKFVYKDDAYDPSRTVPAIRELIEKDEVFAIAGGIGTAPCMAAAGFIEENQVPWISPHTGATHWTIPPKPHIYSIFPLYFDEGLLMADYALNELKATKFGILYVNDDFGKSGLVSVKHQLQQNNLDFVASLPVDITDTDLSSHIARLKESGAEVVFLWVTPRHAAIALGTATVMGFSPAWMASIVLSDMPLMHQITNGAWEGVYFTYIGNTLASDESDPTYMRYKSAFAKYYPEERWGTFPAIGFLLNELVVEGLRRAGENPTRESFLQAIAGIRNYEMAGGLQVSFSEGNHLGLRSLCIMRCRSALEAERMTEMTPITADLSGMIEMLGK